MLTFLSLVNSSKKSYKPILFNLLKMKKDEKITIGAFRSFQDRAKLSVIIGGGKCVAIQTKFIYFPVVIKMMIICYLSKKKLNFVKKKKLKNKIYFLNHSLTKKKNNENNNYMVGRKHSKYTKRKISNSLMRKRKKKHYSSYDFTF